MTAASLECCCCGGGAGRWKQWWNRDDGYGICWGCVTEQRATETPETIRSYYGDEGVNFGPQPGAVS